MGRWNERDASNESRRTVTDPTDPTDPTEFSAEAGPSLTSEEEASLTEALLSAYRPAELNPEVNEVLIELALEDPARPATADERAESERFRRALAGDGEHPDLELVRGLLAAHRSDSAGIAEDRMPDGVSDRALERALGRPSAPAPASKRTRGNVVFVSFGVMTALAAAAAVLLVVAFPSREHASTAGVSAFPAAPVLSQSRSSEALFDAKFEREHTTERIDRIASVRARELRQNRFQQWGVPAP